MSHKMVYVEWIDSCTSPGWHTTAEHAREPTPCASCGFLVNESKTAIVIALNRTTDGESKPWGDLMTIPRVAIKLRRFIR